MRILFYSPDSYGLGHVRRTISVAESILAELPESSALMLTGAPRSHYFDYPPRCDYVKLPSVTKGPDGRYTSREIDMSFNNTVRLRSRLIQEAADCFRPDVVFVDHSPLGLCGEILPTLDSLLWSQPRAFRILGLRDVIDEPVAVRTAWERDRVIDALRSRYDLVLVYGRRDVFDPIRDYGIPPDVAPKVAFVGYIPRRHDNADGADLRRRFAGRTGCLVVVTLGGGGDGNVLLRSFLDGYEALGKEPPFDVAAVTGPLMSPAKRDRFQARAKRLPGVSVIEHVADMPGLLRASDFVVSMGGYNTVCELACAEARALIVPRVFPRREQLVRARLLAERGVVRYLLPDDAGPEALMREVLSGLDDPRPAQGWGLDFGGLNNTVQELRRLTRSSPGAQLPGREARP